jgi:hypothetical protein
MIDRTIFDHITIKRINSPGSIECLIEHLILSRSIELIYYYPPDIRSDVRFII